jgi:hypothetical protein
MCLMDLWFDDGLDDGTRALVSAQVAQYGRAGAVARVIKLASACL